MNRTRCKSRPSVPPIWWSRSKATRCTQSPHHPFPVASCATCWSHVRKAKRILSSKTLAKCTTKVTEDNHLVHCYRGCTHTLVSMHLTNGTITGTEGCADDERMLTHGCRVLVPQHRKSPPRRVDLPAVWRVTLSCPAGGAEERWSQWLKHTISLQLIVRARDTHGVVDAVSPSRDNPTGSRL